MNETALDRAKRKFEQAKAALDAIKARESVAERKKDTRRKIVLGSALLELSKTDKDASALVTRLIAGLSSDHDKKLFEKSAKVIVRKEAAFEPAKAEAPDARPTERLQPQTEPETEFNPPAYSSFPIRRDRDEI